MAFTLFLAALFVVAACSIVSFIVAAVAKARHLTGIPVAVVVFTGITAATATLMAIVFVGVFLLTLDSMGD